MHSRKSFLLNNNEIWVKKAIQIFKLLWEASWEQVWEFVGLYLLNILKSEFGGKNNRLYRDDSLNYFENKSGSKLDKIKKR